MQLLTSYVINQNPRHGNGHNGNIGSNTDNKWKAATGGIAINNGHRMTPPMVLLVQQTHNSPKRTHGQRGIGLNTTTGAIRPQQEQPCVHAVA
jgi:hypothetical protein